MNNPVGFVLALPVFWILLVIPAPARAQDSFERCLKDAVALYENLELKRALEQLQCAKMLARSPAQEVAVALYEGAMLAFMGRREPALALFEKALRLNPDAELPIQDTPKVVQDFEGVRTRVRGAVSPPVSRTQVSESVGSASQGSRSIPEVSVGLSARGMGPPAVWVDRPERPLATGLRCTPNQPFVDVGSSSAAARDRGLSGKWKVPWGLAGASVVVGGMGVVFGLQSRARANEARGALFQDEARDHLDAARGSARAANVLFGTAGLVASGALVAWLVSSNDGGTLDSKEGR